MFPKHSEFSDMEKTVFSLYFFSEIEHFWVCFSCFGLIQIFNIESFRSDELNLIKLQLLKQNILFR